MPRVPLLYGPVPSRRLGYSLGIDLLPYKTCSMDCVYCQLGSSGRTVVRRREFVPASEVLAHVRQALESGRRIDAVTFSGSGEPTLHSGIRRIIRGIKRMTPVPVVVLTNASTLSTPDGRRALAEADIVVPSLDAANERVFAGVNRPHQSLTARKIIDGLAAFRKSYRGRIWLEIMLVKGMNDSPTHLRALKKEKIKAFFGESAEVIASFKDAGQARGPADREAAVLATAGRRPVTAADLSRALGAPVPEIRALAERLARRGRLRKVRHGGRVYFEKGSETAYACKS
jgi:pyruvate-formate lyase-activating enzyme